MAEKIIASNRKARHEFFLSEKFEAGVVLIGSEVKALREGKGNIKESYIRFINRELWIVGMHINEYSRTGHRGHSFARDRKLLLHRRELKKLSRAVDEKGVTLVPTQIYFKDGRVKVEFFIGKGKKLHDKRASIAAKDRARDAERETKNY